MPFLQISRFPKLLFFVSFFAARPRWWVSSPFNSREQHTTHSLLHEKWQRVSKTYLIISYFSRAKRETFSSLKKEIPKLSHRAALRENVIYVLLIFHTQHQSENSSSTSVLTKNKKKLLSSSMIYDFLVFSPKKYERENFLFRGKFYKHFQLQIDMTQSCSCCSLHFSFGC